MDLFNNTNWFLTKCLLSSFGAWPFQSQQYLNIVRGTVTCLILSILIPESFKIWIVWESDRNVLIECATTFLLHLLTMVKLMNCFANFHREKVLLKQIQMDQECISSTVDNELLMNYENDTRRITHCYVYYIYATTITYMITPAVPKVLDWIHPLNESRKSIFLYQAEYFVDGERYKDFILIHSYLITLLPATIVVAFDSLYANLVHHACIMFLLTSRRMERLTCNSSSFQIEGNNNGISYDALIDCIEKHQKALFFAELLQATYTKSLLFVLGINMIAISMTGFQTVMKLNEPAELIRYGSYTIGQLIHLYFLSWPGQKLIHHSEYVHTAAYSADWYDIPHYQRKFLAFIMMRSMKPYTLKAGKIYVMSLRNFSLVVKTSVSYFTVLMSLQL